MRRVQPRRGSRPRSTPLRRPPTGSQSCCGNCANVHTPLQRKIRMPLPFSRTRQRLETELKALRGSEDFFIALICIKLARSRRVAFRSREEDQAYRSCRRFSDVFPIPPADGCFTASFCFIPMIALSCNSSKCST